MDKSCDNCGIENDQQASRCTACGYAFPLAEAADEVARLRSEVVSLRIGLERAKMRPPLRYRVDGKIIEVYAAGTGPVQLSLPAGQVLEVGPNLPELIALREVNAAVEECHEHGCGCTSGYHVGGLAMDIARAKLKGLNETQKR